MLPQDTALLGIGLSRELCGCFMHSGQAAGGDDDLAAALGGDNARCPITEPGGRAGDESERMSYTRFLSWGDGKIEPGFEHVGGRSPCQFWTGWYDT